MAFEILGEITQVETIAAASDAEGLRTRTMAQTQGHRAHSIGRKEFKIKDLL